METEFDSYITRALAGQDVDDTPGTDFNLSIETGCARGLCYALAFVTPFWIAVIAIWALT